MLTVHLARMPNMRVEDVSNAGLALLSPADRVRLYRPTPGSAVWQRVS